MLRRSVLTLVLIGFALSFSNLVGKVLANEENINIYGIDGKVDIYDETESQDSYEGELIQSFVQNWDDLNLYFVKDDGEIDNYTIMDRNMGATEVYNQDFENANIGSYGYHYQWGNNYGFEPCYEEGCSDFPGGENRQDIQLAYFVWKNFVGNFAHNARHSWNLKYIDVPNEDLDTAVPPFVLRTLQQQNLWGGIGDTKTSNGDGTISYGGEEYGTKVDRSGPCPNGYHIPSIYEWNQILTAWNSINKDSEIDNTVGDVDNSGYGSKLASDLLLPPAGIRENLGGQSANDDYSLSGDNGTYNIMYQNTNGKYWSSSPDIGMYNYGKYIEFDKNNRHLDDVVEWGSATNGLSLRCIKNSKNSNINIYPNSGFNAVIGIDGNRITTLSTPIKSGCEFGGWYTESGFSEQSLVRQGDEISDNSSLYAKWIGENCGRNDTQKADCSELPGNASWVNGKFTQTWDGSVWVPTSHENTYSSSSGVECSFKCNTNYSRNSTTKTCVYNSNNGGTNNGGGGGGGGSSSSSVSSNLKISAKSTVNLNEWFGLTITTNKDYRSLVYFGDVLYNSSENKWILVSKTSRYFSAYYPNSNYIMTSSDNGSKTISEFLKFAIPGKYRISVSDRDGKKEYVEVTVVAGAGTNTNSTVNDSVNTNSIDSNNKNGLLVYLVNKYNYVDNRIGVVLSINSNYVGKIDFSKLEYYTGTIRKDVTTSKDYIWESSKEWSNKYYQMVKADTGYKQISNFFKLKVEGKYRLYVKDKDGISNYVEFNVYTSGANVIEEEKNSEIDEELLGLIDMVWSGAYDSIEWNKLNMGNMPEEIYQSRSCKEYRLLYDEELGVFTSPDLQKPEYFVNKDYLKRYIDSKNPQKDNCPTNLGWITASFVDESSSSGHYIAPNGKVYFISFVDQLYFSEDLVAQKKFDTLMGIKNYIMSRNPLISM